MLRFLLVCFFCVLPSPLLAEWFESQGEAIIIEGNKQQARSQAIENALKKSLLIAGATVSSVKQVVNGLLTENSLQIRASGDVQSLELIDETISDNVVNVTIRADIFPRMRQCFSAHYKKPIVLSRASIKNRVQANIGQLFEFDMAATEQMAEIIASQAQFIDVKLLLNKRTGFNRLINNIDQAAVKKLTTGMADMADSQYILFSEIEDLSFVNASNWNLLSSKQRRFAVTGYLYDGINGEMLAKTTHAASAPWSFDDRDKVDVNSASFWQSDYGKMSKTLLANLVTDLDEALMCDPTRARVLSVNGSEVTLNMGRENGVKIGDEFSLVHVVNHEPDNGKVTKFYRVSQYKVKVSSVTRQTANAVSVEQVLGNVQRDDIAVRQ